MQKTLLTIAGVLLVVAVVYYGRWLFSGERELSPEDLARQALEAPTSAEREEAAVKLASLGEEAAEHMAQVLTKSDSAPVRAAMIQGLAAQWNYDIMHLLIDALDDESPLVRGRAGTAVQRMLGADFGLRYNDSAKKREAMIKIIRREWGKYRNSPLLEQWKKRLKKGS